MSNPIPGTGIAVVTDRLWSLRVFYQLLNGRLEQSKHLDGVWTNEALTFSPVDDTPLAAITYNSGKEVSKTPLRLSHTQLDGRFGQIRVYYLDSDYIVQEYCYTEGKNWYKGEIGNKKAKAVPAAGLAAVVFGSDVLGSGEKGVHIRVYYQSEYHLLHICCQSIKTPGRARHRNRRRVGK